MLDAHMKEQDCKNLCILFYIVTEILLKVALNTITLTSNPLPLLYEWHH